MTVENRPIQPYDFVSAADSESVGMVLTLAAYVFDAGMDGPPTDVLVVWISGDCTWENPGDLTKLDSLTEMTAKGMIAMWEHGSESGSKLTMQQIKRQLGGK